ncbi:hypothetical protein [Sporomusa aerivorans]|uniref:hypothetical protein n=1 Tax=Sporomusa aerivorans TaxID=204936 RepID=UPI00352AC688
MKKLRILFFFSIIFSACIGIASAKLPDMSNEVISVNHAISPDFKKESAERVQSRSIMAIVSKKEYKSISTFDNFMIISHLNPKHIRFMLLGEKGPVAEKSYFVDKDTAYADYINIWDVFRMDSGTYYILVVANEKIVGNYGFVVTDYI